MKPAYNALAGYSIIYTRYYFIFGVLAMSYEEIFIPEPIKETGARVLVLPEKYSGLPGKDFSTEDFSADNAVTENFSPAPAKPDVTDDAEEIICACGGLEGKVFIKNYLRLIVQCDSINRMLYLDLFEKRHKLYGIYDRYGRVRRGVTAQLSKDYKVYRLKDGKNGKTCIVKLQDIKCNKTDEPLGFLYSLWDSPDSEEPFYAGVTY